MEQWTSRTQLLIGAERLYNLSTRNVLIVGVGGVGAYAAEMIVRAGIGNITIIDGDVVNETNLNRQLIALNSTIGQVKVDAMKYRLLDINPTLNINAINMFITVDDIPKLFQNKAYDYVIDAIDTVAPKVALIEYCLRSKVKIISSMGAGGRINPSVVQYADIADTYHDGLAKVVRTRLRESGISHGLKVVWSPEQPSKSAMELTSESQNKRSSYGTISYLPCIFGCMLASHVIRKFTTL
ncbi:MAG: tRNA threonylcarbamoyladenosine dehydratase [Muribaculaceae bacterium]